MEITHTFVSAKADGPDSSLIRPSNWNAQHAVTGLVLPGGSASLPNAKFINVFGSNLGAGDNDLYTVPANKRGLLQMVVSYNHSGGALTWFVEMKVSGVYYRLTSLVSPGDQIFSQTGNAVIVLNAGETFSVNVSGGTGLNVWAQVIEFDDSAIIKTARLTSFVNGDNTLYTVPVGKTASFFNTAGGAATYTTPSVSYGNFTGGAAITIKSFAVPNGGSSSVNNQTYPATSVSNGSAFFGPADICLGPGDSMVLNSTSNAAGQIAWINVLELG